MESRTVLPAEERVRCVLCGGDREIPVARQDGYRVVRCQDCGLVYVNPRPSPDRLRAHYVSYLPEDEEGREAWARMMRRIFADAAERIDARFPRRGRLLDVGCAYGFFLEVMQARGWQVVGVDLNPGAVQWARRRGLDVRAGTLEEQGFPKGTFDVVTLFYVLEHVPNPLAVMQEVFRVLRPGGWVFLRVPDSTPAVRLLDFFGIPNRLYHLPSHLYDFSPGTLRRLLEKAGFVEVKTFLQRCTSPAPWHARVLTHGFHALAVALYGISRGRWLLPGVSKTTTAVKPLLGHGTIP